MNTDLKFPRGIQNPADGANLGMSNIAYSATDIFVGGQFDSDQVYEGGLAWKNTEGIAFLQKNSILGSHNWTKFYNHQDTSFLVSIAYISDTAKVYAHFSGGLVALIDSATGFVTKAIKISNEFVSFAYNSLVIKY